VDAEEAARLHQVELAVVHEDAAHVDSGPKGLAVYAQVSGVGLEGGVLGEGVPREDGYVG
jgi:hypothetical protein